MDWERRRGYNAITVAQKNPKEPVTKDTVKRLGDFLREFKTPAEKHELITEIVYTGKPDLVRRIREGLSNDEWAEAIMSRPERGETAAIHSLDSPELVRAVREGLSPQQWVRALSVPCDCQPSTCGFGVMRQNSNNPKTVEVALEGISDADVPARFIDDVLRSRFHVVSPAIYAAASGRLPHDHADIRKVIEEKIDAKGYAEFLSKEVRYGVWGDSGHRQESSNLLEMISEHQGKEGVAALREVMVRFLTLEGGGEAFKAMMANVKEKNQEIYSGLVSLALRIGEISGEEIIDRALTKVSPGRPAIPPATRYLSYCCARNA